MEFLLNIILLMVAIPITVFFSVKFGTYAYFKARKLIEEVYKDVQKK
jgi:hypothetical protein